MAEHKGAIKIDTQMNTQKIEGDFRKIETKTKNMINQYNKSVDSIKSQELAIQKVKDKIEELQGYKEWGVLKENEAQKLNELNAKLPLLNSKLSETKKRTSELGESIKENLNKKANMLGIQNGIDGVGKKIDKLKNKLTRMFTTVMLFSLVRKGLTALRNNFMSLLGTNETFNNSLNQIKANLMTAFAPIYNACLPAINSLMSALSKLTGTIAVFVSGLFGKSIEQAKNEAQGLSKALKSTAKSGKEATNSLSSIDEIQNVEEDKDSGSSGIDYSGELEYSSKLLEILNKIKDVVVKAIDFIDKHKVEILAFLAGVIGALVAMKVIDFINMIKDGEKLLEITTKFKGILKGIGIGIAVAGIVYAIMAVLDYLKDPSWENFGKIIIGIGIAVAGVGIAFGLWPVAIAGAIVAVVGVIIKYWEQIKSFFQGIIDWFTGKSDWVREHFGNVIGDMYDTFVGALQLMLDGFDNLFSGLKQILDGIIEFVKGVFSGDWKQAWEGVKKIFSGIFQSLLGIIQVVLGTIRSTVGTVVTGVGTIISNIFKAIVNAVLSTIENTLNAPIRTVNTLIGVINKVPGINLGRLPTFNLPRLATGAVIPPRSEFMAVLGDQKRGVNIETPLSTMIEAFNKALDGRDGGMATDLLLELNRNISELANRPIVMNINGKQFAQATYTDYQNEGNRLNYSSAIKVK